MKKSFKKLRLNKDVVSKLDLNKITGKGATHCCPTDGPLNSCPGPGQQCF